MYAPNGVKTSPDFPIPDKMKAWVLGEPGQPGQQVRRTWRLDAEGQMERCLADRLGPMHFAARQEEQVARLKDDLGHGRARFKIHREAVAVEREAVRLTLAMPALAAV